jgi:hypothetical protein
MQKYRSTYISDEFEGWDGDTVYELDDGTKWKLATYQYKYVYKYRPKATLWRDGGRYYLEVDGMGKPVHVHPDN